MRISDWSSDVCSSDLKGVATMLGLSLALAWPIGLVFAFLWIDVVLLLRISSLGGMVGAVSAPIAALLFGYPVYAVGLAGLALIVLWRHKSEEHTSELQSLMRISYAVFCLKKKRTNPHPLKHYQRHNKMLTTP